MIVKIIENNKNIKYKIISKFLNVYILLDIN